MNLKQIAVIYTDFPEKFGIPRQSGLADTRGKIVFEKEYRNPDALKGLEEYSHLWLLWGFSANKGSGETYRPMVRPPRLGGNQRVGVFATRSPYRPNPIGLSCVELIGIEKTKEAGMVIWVSGADLMDQTPIYDIKPYLSYTDAKPEAAGGFSDRVRDDRLEVEIEERWLAEVPVGQRKNLEKILSQDPRPSYQEDKQRIYGMVYAGMEVRFRVDRERLIVCGIQKRNC